MSLFNMNSSTIHSAIVCYLQVCKYTWLYAEQWEIKFKVVSGRSRPHHHANKRYWIIVSDRSRPHKPEHTLRRASQSSRILKAKGLSACRRPGMKQSSPILITLLYGKEYRECRWSITRASLRSKKTEKCRYFSRIYRKIQSFFQPKWSPIHKAKELPGRTHLWNFMASRLRLDNILKENRNFVLLCDFHPRSGNISMRNKK